MKRFIVEVDDKECTMDEINSILYLGNKSPEISTYFNHLKATHEVREENQYANGSSRMTTKQRDALWELCGRYNVPFRESDYVIYQGAFKGLLGMAEGWIGGPMMNGHNNQGKTIYIGVTPDGIANS